MKKTRKMNKGYDISSFLINVSHMEFAPCSKALLGEDPFQFGLKRNRSKIFKVLLIIDNNILSDNSS